MTAYVAGVNAFISSQQAKLPIEFVLTGIRPEPWTLQTLLLRQVTFGDATSELQLARSVAELGVAEANRSRNPDPWDDLQVPHRVDVSAVARSFAALTESMRTTLDRIQPEILPQFRSMVSSSPEIQRHAIAEPGSNNWVLSGSLSETGKPVVSNDPHREVTLPSLSYRPPQCAGLERHRRS